MPQYKRSGGGGSKRAKNHSRSYKGLKNRKTYKNKSRSRRNSRRVMQSGG